MTPTFDVAMVGAGIVGLAHAFHFARRGRRVIVFERSARACGASIRNFRHAMADRAAGRQMHEMALRSRESWLEVLAASRLWHEQTGSLHLAYREDEAQVLAEFAERARGRWLTSASLLSPGRSRRALAGGQDRRPPGRAVEPDRNLRRSAASDRRAARLAARENSACDFEFGCAVTGYEHPHVCAGGNAWTAEPTGGLLGRRLSNALSRRVCRRRFLALQIADDALASLRLAVCAGADAGRRA